MKFKAPIFAVSFAVFLSGCGSYYTRSVPIGPIKSEEANVLVTDIRQRAIISGTPKDGGRAVTCAEPSPDAMSTLSASVSAAFENQPDLSLKLAQSFSESAAFVGNRTQTIQLLRDGMYRLCEGYMSGGMSAYQYQWMMRRYQRNMVGILAIESLTDTISVPSATLTGSASASFARSILDLEERLSEVNDEIAGLEEKIKELDDTETEKKTELTTSVDRYKDTKKILEDAVKNSQSLLASSSTVAAQQKDMEAKQGQTTKNENALKIIGNIIEKIYDKDDFDGLCLEVLMSVDSSRLAQAQKFCTSEASIKAWIN